MEAAKISSHNVQESLAAHIRLLRLKAAVLTGCYTGLYPHPLPLLSLTPTLCRYFNKLDLAQGGAVHQNMLPSPLSSRLCGLVTLPPGTVNEVVYVWEEGVGTLDLTLYRKGGWAWELGLCGEQL